MICIECGNIIPEERLKTLPNTETCIECSVEEPIFATQSELDGILPQCEGELPQ